MPDRVRAWLRSLELPQRRWLAAVTALVVVTAGALGVSTVVGGDDRGAALAVETEGDDGSDRTTSPGGEEEVIRSSTTTTAGGRTSTTITRPQGAGTAATTAPRGADSTVAPVHDSTVAPVPDSSSTTPPSTSTTARVVTRDAAVEARISELFVTYRAAQVLPAMARASGLDQVAVDWARHLAEQERLSHQPLATIAAACASPCHAAENVAQNHNADDTWAAWLASETHHRNITNGSSGAYGVGAYRSADGRLWVVHVFGRDRS